MEIRKVSAKQISELFDKERSIYFQIPKYQREYTWGNSQWTALYDDLIENDKGYFIGSIIYIPDSDDALELTPLEVVDGQQRLTTICLLIAALKSTMETKKGEMSEDEADEIGVLKRMLFKKGAEDSLIIRLQEQNNNRLDFIHTMGVAGILNPPSKAPPYYGNRNIKRCYDFFKKQIQNDMDESDNPIATLFAIKDKVVKAVLVTIEVGSHADAFVMFESLNKRGMPLTAVDLMKNAALAEASDIDECYAEWQEVVELISSDYTAQERFFRFNYNAFRKEMNEPFRAESDTRAYPLGDLATRSNLLDIYLKLIKHDLHGFLEYTKASAEVYARLMNPIDEDGLKKEISDLNHIQGVAGYILLMYLLRNQADLRITDKQMKSLVGLLSRFFVRRNLTDTPKTRDINRMFMNLVSEIKERGLKSDDLVTWVRESLISRSASDDAFREKLSGDVYTENSDAARYILCALAESYMTDESWTNFWRQEGSGNKTHYVWTIEHILPEGNNMRPEWVDMIAKGDAEKASELRAAYCHKLGNLTLTGYNSNLGNMSFERKRDRKDDNDRFIGYRNGLGLNSDLAGRGRWTVDDIQARTDKLVSRCMELFEL